LQLLTPILILDNTDFIRLNPIGDVDNSYDYTEVSLMKIGADNYTEIDNLIKNLDPLFTYALIFLIRVRDTGEVVTLDRHRLVNNTTPTLPIVKRIYNRIDALGARYNFQSYDRLILKVRKLIFKVGDSSSSATATANNNNNNVTKNVNLDSSLDINITKIKKWSFIPKTMDHTQYGKLELQDGNKFTYINKKCLIEVDVKEEGIYHILKIMSLDTSSSSATATSDIITIIEDLKNTEEGGEGFIRYYNESDIYVEYNKYGIVYIEPLF